MTEKGMFWHVHHDILLEYCYDYNKRVQFIKENKPKNEAELRLQLFKKVKGKLPVAVVKAGDAYDKARAACNKAWAAYNKARTAYDKARAACNKAWAAYNKARTVCDKAWAVYVKALKDNILAIEKLHCKECPGCTWDGTTIFSKGAEK